MYVRSHTYTHTRIMLFGISIISLFTRYIYYDLKVSRMLYDNYRTDKNINKYAIIVI